EAKAQRDLLESYLGQYREAIAQADLQELPTEARIVSRASVSSQPSFPRKLPILMVTTFASAFLAIGIIVSAELIALSGTQAPQYAQPRPVGRREDPPRPVFENKTFAATHDDQTEIGDETNVELEIRDDDETAIHDHQTPEREDVHSDEVEIASPASGSLHTMPDMDKREAVLRVARLVSTNKMDGEGLRVYVCSPQRQSMNNFAALNIARQLSDDGERVVLVDINSRTPRIAYQMGIDYNPGFSDLLVENSSFLDVLQRDPLSRLHAITAGSEGIDLYGSEHAGRLDQLLDALENTYTYVILDGPPVMLTTESGLFASMSDVAVLVPDTLPGGQRMTLRARDTLTDHGRHPVEVLIANSAIADNAYDDASNQMQSAV
ncbi:MAG: hypothetical protein K8F25_18185, partial [Fimbriimonadaceae bacterium]|nr:hypothetical protein [Alphaproteobacteria bacterium]